MQKLTADGRVIPVAPAKPASERAGIAAPFLPLAIVGATP
jgi:hypothetical protein